MSWKMLLTMTLVLMIAPALYYAPAGAQETDCGEFCNGCGPGAGYKEGTGAHPEGAFNMACVFVGIGEPCVLCEVPGSHDFVSSDVIARAVQSASTTELELLIVAYGDRLLFSPERRAVIIKGVPCDHERISKMVFITADKARGFQTLGVRPLAAFLEEQNAQVAAEDLRENPRNP